MMNAGVKIPIWIWIIDAHFQLTNKLSKIISDRWMHWLELFYHQHRMAHLPKVGNNRLKNVEKINKSLGVRSSYSISH